MNKKILSVLLIVFSFSTIFAAGWDVDGFNWFDFCKAVERGEKPCVDNVDFNRKNEYGHTALYYAIERGPVVVQYLIDHGAKVNLVCDNDGNYPLYWACSITDPVEAFDVASCLVKNKANVNSKNEYKLTPLHGAAQNANKDLCEFLLNNGAKIDAKEEAGYTPLMIACYATSDLGDIAGTRRLLVQRGANVNVKNDGKENLLNLLFESDIDIYGNLYLLDPDPDFLKELVNRGVNINQKNINGYTPLFSLVCDSKYQSGTEDVIRDLVALGADTEIEDDYGMTPLVFSCRMGLTHTVKALLAAGADYNKKLDGVSLFDYCKEQIENNSLLSFAYEDILALLNMYSGGLENYDWKEFYKNLKVTYTGKYDKIFDVDEATIFEALWSCDVRGDNIIRIHAKSDYGKTYITRCLSMNNYPVILDLTDYYPEELTEGQHLFYLKDIYKIVFSPHKSYEKNNGADLFYYNLSNFPDLEEVIIPDGIKMIDRFSFFNMKQLRRVVVPESVTKIYEGAFWNCPKLTEVVIKSGKTVLQDDIFNSCPNAVVKVEK